MNKIYLISYLFAPVGRAPGINRTYLAKYLAEEGWDIDVISCANPHGLFRSFPLDKALLDILPPSVHLHPIKSFYWGAIGGMGALLKLWEDPFHNWYRPVMENSQSLLSKKGILYAVVPPVINARIAFDLSRRTKMPFLMDFRDNVYDLPAAKVKASASIIASSVKCLQDMREHYDLPDITGRVIYNGYPVECHPDKAVNEKSDSLKIIYTGLMGMAQSPVLVARAVRLLERIHPETRDRINLEYYGPANYYTKFFLRRYLGRNIHYRGYLPFMDTLRIIAGADLLSVTLQPGKRDYSYAIPSKIFQALATATPVLAAGTTGGALQDFVVSNGIGRFSAADDIENQAEDIYSFWKNPHKRREMVENIKKIKVEYHTRYQARLLSEHLRMLFN
ncbi:MAG: hypothetical protein JXB60_03785 [Candidatus Cloacimonetes bacterium]|nr:hypothetical protein [Candidatus Cloacimonadota bacterium]